MKPSLFITGAGGFLGKHLLEKLDTKKYKTIYCLSRKREDVQVPSPFPDNIEIIRGDLLEPSTYEFILDKTDTIIHMAAVTGKVDPKDYFKVNAYAVMLLLDRCKKAGVKNFLFISSIAVSFKNKYRYFYAQSKEQAEQYVKTSGLHFTILRPTMIMGKGSPVFTGLAQLASLPLIPIFGNGKIQIQPLHVADAANAICSIVEEQRFRGEVLELGGAESITIKEFMKGIARRQGKRKPKVLHLPLRLIAFFLSILERLVYRLLPITVGQLASFRNDSTAKENTLQHMLAPRMKDVNEIIDDSLKTENETESLADIADIPAELQKECRTFCRYLVKQDPNTYVLHKYNKCHQKKDLSPEDFHDKLLIKLAGIRPFFTRMTDAYSRFFRPNSTPRKKLAYLMAILDVTPPYYRYYDKADGPGKLGFLIKAGLLGCGLFFHLLISFLFLFPIQIASKFSGKK